MNTAEVLVAIAKGLDLEAGEVNLESTSETIEDWDSLGHLAVLSALDDATAGRSSELIDLTQAASVREIIDILKHGGILQE